MGGAESGRRAGAPLAGEAAQRNRAQRGFDHALSRVARLDGTIRGRMMWRAAGWLALLISSLPLTVEAQRGPRPSPVATADDKTIRSELAAVLLQEGRY